MSDNRNEVVAAKTIVIDGLPVAVCVVTLADGVLSLGYTISKPENFEPDLAGFIAKRNAIAQIPGVRAKLAHKK